MEQNKKTLWIQIISLSLPLILSMAGVMIMQLVDAVFLAWYSTEAISAVVPAGMGAYLITCPFQATAGFTSTLVAHYIGAGKTKRAYSVTWQGIYCSLVSGFIVAGIGFWAEPFFKIVGHAESVQPLEVTYFSISCWGAFPVIAASAISGFFTGRGKTLIVMVVQLSGIALNAVIAYLLIFGKWFFPEWGITGAAIATVGSQIFVALLLFIAFMKTKTENCGNPWTDRKFDKELFTRLIHFGFPNGLRIGFEMLAWTSFVLIVGRIGVNELAATNIAFRINGFSFFPVIGIGMAVAILVGQAQGQCNFKQSIRITYTGFALAELWMLFSASIFLLFPSEIYSMFGGEGYTDFSQVKIIGEMLLKLIAVYCLLDAGNIIFVSALQAAGDTRWTMIFSFIANGFFLCALVLADIYKMGIWVEWVIATVFVMVVAFLWFFRFRSGKWHNIHVVETPAE